MSHVVPLWTISHIVLFIACVYCSPWGIDQYGRPLVPNSSSKPLMVKARNNDSNVNATNKSSSTSTVIIIVVVVLVCSSLLVILFVLIVRRRRAKIKKHFTLDWDEDHPYRPWMGWFGRYKYWFRINCSTGISIKSFECRVLCHCTSPSDMPQWRFALRFNFKFWRARRYGTTLVFCYGRPKATGYASLDLRIRR